MRPWRTRLPVGEVGGWVGELLYMLYDWVGWVEEEEAVGMRCCGLLGCGWVGGEIGGKEGRGRRRRVGGWAGGWVDRYLSCHRGIQRECQGSGRGGVGRRGRWT